MPYYYRRRSRWPYRSWRRWGVSRAQSQGTRRFTVSFPAEISIGVPTGKLSSVFSVHPFYSSTPGAGSPSLSEFRNCYGNLMTNATFQTYCGLYDEVKINSVSVNLAILTVPTGSSAKIYSAVDRHANLRDVLADYNPAQISNGPECKTTVFTSLDRAKMWRYVKARDVGERTYFLDASWGNCGVAAYNNSAGVAVPAHTITANRDWFDSSSVFAPMISFYIELTGTPPGGSTIGISLSVRWNVTFRNPKYSSGGDAAMDGDDPSSNAKFSQLKSEALSDMVDDDVSDGGALRKKVKFDEPVYEESVLPDDEEEEESSQPELTKEELLEMLKKYEEKKS